jgi:hypothetical protein
MSVKGAPPAPKVAIVDPRTGLVSRDWFSWLNTLWARTGRDTGVDAAVVAARVPPAGGTTGQLLAKFSDADYDYVWKAVAGTVTSVALASSDLTISGSPITTSGTITADLATQAGVTPGSYNNFTVNAKGIVTAASSAAYLTGNQSITLSGDVSGTGATAITATLASVGTAGTYTKVTTDAKGRVTSGAAAALASSDFANQGTTHTLLHGNAAGNPSWGAVDLTADVSGTLPVANGGTGAATASANQLFAGPSSGGAAAPGFRSVVGGDLGITTAGDLLVGASASPATSAPTRIADVAAGSFLRSGGVGSLPAWSTVTIPNAGTLGDLWYCSASNVISALAGNTTSTRNKLVQTGTGSASAAPSWVEDDWEYLGGAAPLGAGSTTLLANTTIAARDQLKIMIGVTGYGGGGSTVEVTFNNSATGHTYRWLVNAAGGTTWAAGSNTGSNGASIKVGPANGTNPRTVVIEIENRPDTSEKPIICRSVTGKNSSSTQNDIDLFAGSFYAGASTQITQVKVFAGANINAGSFVQIFGRNATA